MNGTTAVQDKEGSAAGKGDKRDKEGRCSRQKRAVDTLISESESIALSQRDYALLAQVDLPGLPQHEAVTKFLAKMQLVK